LAGILFLVIAAAATSSLSAQETMSMELDGVTIPLGITLREANALLKGNSRLTNRQNDIVYVSANRAVFGNPMQVIIGYILLGGSAGETLIGVCRCWGPSEQSSGELSRVLFAAVSATITKETSAKIEATTLHRPEAAVHTVAIRIGQKTIFITHEEHGDSHTSIGSVEECVSSPGFKLGSSIPSQR
jgi:hypothetical protein